MKDASSFMSDTLNDVLSLQKIEEGKLELEMVPFNIVDSVHKVIATLTCYIQSKHINIVTNIANNLPLSILGTV
jgi:signal transduction histidine kinase